MGKLFNLKDSNPLVFEIIKGLCFSQSSADRDQISQAIKQDKTGSAMIKKARENHPDQNEDDIAGNMVDWFSRNYTENKSSAKDAIKLFERFKEKRLNPTSGKFREVWVYQTRSAPDEQQWLERKDRVEIPYADEIAESSSLKEGAYKKVSVNAYERNPEARERCIRKWGLKCAVCNFNFESFYGRLGMGYIHVHHLKPLSEIREQYEINPEEDLRPVCPNCHSMLHRREPVLSIEALQELVRSNGG